MTNSSYEAALHQTVRQVRYFIVITSLSTFLYGGRTAIWIQYAKEFDDFSMHVASWILYSDSLLIGVAGIVFASMGDYIGFDKSITLKLLLITVGCIVEAIATNFTVLCIGFLVSQTATLYVTLAFIAWILPKTEAKKHINILYTSAIAAYLLGPVFCGILFRLLQNYRYIFICNAVLMAISFLFTLLSVFGQQSKLHQVQIASMSSIDVEISDAESSRFIQDDQEQEQFPSYLEQQNQSNLSLRFWSELQLSPLTLLCNLLTQMCIMAAVEPVLITYYVPFIVAKSGNSDANTILLSTLQLSAMSLSMMIVTGLMSVYADAFAKLYESVSPQRILIALYSAFVLLCAPYLYFECSVHWYWIFTIIFGGMHGMCSLILEGLLVEVQPAKHAGKINGIRAIGVNVVRGVLLLLIGLEWSSGPNVMIYVIAGGCMFALVLGMASLTQKAALSG